MDTILVNQEYVFIFIDDAIILTGGSTDQLEDELADVLKVFVEKDLDKKS